MKINVIGECNVTIVCDAKSVIYITDDMVVMFKKLVRKWTDEDDKKNDDGEVYLTQAIRIKPGQLNVM